MKSHSVHWLLGLQPNGRTKDKKVGAGKVPACCMKRTYDSLTCVSRHPDRRQKWQKDVLSHTHSDKSWRVYTPQSLITFDTASHATITASLPAIGTPETVILSAGWQTCTNVCPLLLLPTKVKCRARTTAHKSGCWARTTVVVELLGSLRLCFEPFSQIGNHASSLTRCHRAEWESGASTSSWTSVTDISPPSSSRRPWDTKTRRLLVRGWALLGSITDSLLSMRAFGTFSSSDSLVKTVNRPCLPSATPSLPERMNPPRSPSLTWLLEVIFKCLHEAILRAAAVAGVGVGHCHVHNVHGCGTWVKNLRCGWASATDLSHSHAETVICKTWNDVSAFSQPDEWLVVWCPISWEHTVWTPSKWGDTIVAWRHSSELLFKRRSCSIAWSRRCTSAKSVINMQPSRCNCCPRSRHASPLHANSSKIPILGGLRESGWLPQWAIQENGFPPANAIWEPRPRAVPTWHRRLYVDRLGMETEWPDQQFFEHPLPVCDQTFLLLLIGKSWI